MKFYPGQTIKHPYHGLGTVEDVTGRAEDTRVTVKFGNGSRQRLLATALAKALGETFTPEDAVVGETEEDIRGNDTTFTFAEMKRALRSILDETLAVSDVPLGNRWVGGKVILQPRDEGLKPKELPVETFFHKIVMVRDRLRVLEQQINNHSKLDDEDRVHLQQYITRAYGSLTTFNALFREKDDQFRGSSS